VDPAARACGKPIASVAVMDHRQSLGKRGEDVACAELEKRGYEILERRFRTRRGEIDIVARDAGVLVFVEVKARSDSNFGTPLEAVTWRKRQRLSQMAAAYLCHKRLANVACRFDVISINEMQGAATIELVRSAFDMQSPQR
jgi:putative endonuclease